MKNRWRLKKVCRFPDPDAGADREIHEPKFVDCAVSFGASPCDLKEIEGRLPVFRRKQNKSLYRRSIGIRTGGSRRQRPTLTLFIKSRCIIQLLLHKTHESRIVPPSLSWCCYLCKFIWTAAAGDYLYVHLPKIGARNIQRKVARRSSPGRNWCFSFVSRFGSFV